MKTFSRFFSLASCLVLVGSGVLLPGMIARGDTVSVKSGSAEHETILKIEGVTVNEIRKEGVTENLYYTVNSSNRTAYKALKTVVQIEAAGEALFNQAEAAFANGDFKSAGDDYRKAITKPRIKDWIKQRCDEQLLKVSSQTGDFLGAVVDFVEVARRDPAAASQDKPTVDKGTKKDLIPQAISAVLSGLSGATVETKRVLFPFLAELYNANGQSEKAVAVGKESSQLQAGAPQERATTQPSSPLVDKRSNAPSAPPTPRMSAAQRDAALADAGAELQKLQQSEPETRVAAAGRAKTSAEYRRAAKQLADAETYRKALGDSGTREQRQKAGASVTEATAHLTDLTQMLVDSDAQVAAVHKRVLELRAKLENLNTQDLLDALGDDPNAHAVAGRWEFKGNSLLVSSLSRVTGVRNSQNLRVFEPGLDDLRGNPLAWDRAAVHFPGDAPEQYVLTIRLRRIGAGTSGPDVMIPVRNGTLVCEFDSTRNYAQIGEAVDPQVLAQMAVVSPSGSLIRGNSVHEIIIRVEAAGRRVVVTVDGKRSLEWHHSMEVKYPTDLKGQMPPPHQIGICVTNAPIELLSVRLLPIPLDANAIETGTGRQGR